MTRFLAGSFQGKKKMWNSRRDRTIQYNNDQIRNLKNKWENYNQF